MAPEYKFMQQMVMWQIFGVGIGLVLGVGLAGRGTVHWAVRVLSAVFAGMVIVALLLAWLFCGKDSPAGGMLVSMLLAFALTIVVLGGARLVRSSAAAVPWLKANPGKVASMVIGVAMAAARGSAAVS